MPRRPFGKRRRVGRHLIPDRYKERCYQMGSGVGVVVQRLRARRGELIEAIFAGVRDVAFGSVGAQDAEYVAGLRAAVVASVDYVLEGIERECSPEQRRVEQVRGLLDGGEPERAELDYDMDAWHLGVIAVGAGAARAVLVLGAGVDRRLLSVAQGEQSVWAWLGGRERFVVADVERLVGMGSHRSASVVLALGEPARGLEGWRLTHRQAQAALVVALRRNGIPRNGIPPAQGVMLTRYGDVALLASALKDELLGRALIDVYLAPLRDARDGGAVLRQTLRAYLAAERSVSSTAAALGVARKTVAGRLRTIEERLGRTLRPCPAELEVALELDELAAAPLEPAGPPQPPGAPEISSDG
jgi:hypothetical protein